MLMAKVRAGGSGVWGSNVMPPHAGISDEDLRALVRWSLAGGN
jgi:cytochrome c